MFNFSHEGIKCQKAFLGLLKENLWTSRKLQQRASLNSTVVRSWPLNIGPKLAPVATNLLTSLVKEVNEDDFHRTL